MTHSVLRIDDADRIEMDVADWWRPLRRALGVTAFGVNAYTADAGGRPADRDPRRDELRRRGARLSVRVPRHA